jgi:hypothetical protein
MAVLALGPLPAAQLPVAVNVGVAKHAYRFPTQPISTDLNHPWLIGYRQPQFRIGFWQYVAVDPALRAARQR